MVEMTSVELPEYAVFVQEIAEGVLVCGLQITTSGTEHKFLLVPPQGNYEDIARRLHRNIMDAGREMRKRQSGLVVVKDMPDALRKRK